MLNLFCPVKSSEAGVAKRQFNRDYLVNDKKSRLRNRQLIITNRKSEGLRVTYR